MSDLPLDALKHSRLKSDEKQILEIHLEHPKMKFYAEQMAAVSNSEKSDTLLIFYPGRVYRKKPLPVFQRSTLQPFFPCHTMVLCDPCLFLNDSVVLCWFMGTEENDPIITFSRYLSEEYLPKHQISKIILYGTSAGAIPAFRTAQHLPNYDVTVVTGNAQTNVERYYPEFWEDGRKTCFPSLSLEELRAKYEYRYNIIGANGDFPIHYLQNTADTFHLENHAEPFFENFPLTRKKNDLDYSQKLNYMTYSNPLTGHGPLPKIVEIAILKCIIERRDYSSFLSIDPKLLSDDWADENE